jgi:hypothetical protein
MAWFQYVVDAQSVEMGFYDERCVILHGLDRKRYKIPPPKTGDTDFFALWDIQNPASENSTELYKSYINQNALCKLERDIKHGRLFNQSSLNYLLGLCELRQVTTVFIKIGSIKFESFGNLKETQEAMYIVQTVLAKYEGSLRQFHVDDKGSVILAFFVSSVS